MVTSLPPIATVASRPEGDRLSRRELGQRLAVVERNPLVERKPGQRPVHRAGVEIPHPEPRRDRSGDRALPRSRGAVDRNHERLAHGVQLPSGGPLTRRASSMLEEPREAHGDGGGVVDPDPLDSRQARQRRRASRCDGRRASRFVHPRTRVGTPVTTKPSVGAPDSHADRAERVDRRLDAVALLRPQLGGTAKLAGAAGERRRQREERELVDRAAEPPSRSPSSRRGRRCGSRDRLPARRRALAGCRR